MNNTTEIEDYFSCEEEEQVVKKNKKMKKNKKKVEEKPNKCMECGILLEDSIDITCHDCFHKWCIDELGIECYCKGFKRYYKS